VSYCGVKHQKQHWSSHRSQCSPWKICQSDRLGHYLVAGRDLEPGDLVLDEDVAILGPADDESRVCTGCYFPTHGYTCSTCGAPLCGPSCEHNSDHQQECEVISRYAAGDQDIQQFISVLRFLRLKTSDPARYKKCRQLSTNLELRRDQPDFQSTRDKVAEFIKIFPDIATEEVVLAIFCILDTNTFQVLSSGSAYTLSGLYPRVSLLNHSCVPNCRLVFRSDYSLQVVTSVRVRRGDTLCISYTPPFYSVIARNNILQRGKQFTCSCARCSDPTELGTRVSSIRCTRGDTCGGSYQHCQDYSGDWRCSDCDHTLPYSDYALMDARLLGVQTRFDKSDVDQMKSILREQRGTVSPDHGLILEVEQHLAAALGRVDGHRFDQISDEDLQLKIDISQHLMKVLNVLEPGLSKSRGITLLDMAECKARLILKSKDQDDAAKYTRLLKVEEELAEAWSILKYEDEKAIEGNVSKKAQADLKQLRHHLNILKSNLK